MYYKIFRYLLIGFISVIFNPIVAQLDSHSTVSISAYVETYYSYDLGTPANHNRPGFVYSHNRHNEVNLNLGYIKIAHSANNSRANLAIMAGTYSNANLASEPGVLKNIYEANVGVALSKTGRTWLDIGVFGSHIGFESAVGKDCWNLTRSIMADNSPYYESGIKLTHTNINNKWYFAALFLNGWQKIQRVKGNNTAAFGHQVIFKPSKNISLNSSSFVGNDFHDSLLKMRYFHNFYGIFQIKKKLGIIAGFDIGLQQNSKGSAVYQTWYTPVIISRYSITNKLTIAARWEYYSDKNNVIISGDSINGFTCIGYSVNLDYSVSPNTMMRIEGRNLRSPDAIFMKQNNPSLNNIFFTTALAVSF